MTRISDLQDELPSMTWTQLETVMLSLANSDTKKLIVTHLVEGTRKQAPFLPAEEVIREILCIGFALMDQDFQPPVPGPKAPLRA
jgi:hypothetical protein